MQMWLRIRMLNTGSHLVEKCSPWGPNVVQKRSQKRTKRQLQTVISDFGRAPVRVLSPSPWFWLPTAAWDAGCRPKEPKRGGQSGSSSIQGSPARRFWRIAVLPQPRRLWKHLQASFFGHHWMACDHPCALISGVGPCLHLCKLCKYGFWNLECNINNGMWRLEHGLFIWSTAWRLSSLASTGFLQHEEWSTDRRVWYGVWRTEDEAWMQSLASGVWGAA